MINMSKILASLVLPTFREDYIIMELRKNNSDLKEKIKEAESRMIWFRSVWINDLLR